MKPIKKKDNAAYNLLKEYVLKYITDNFIAISIKYGVTKKNISDLKKDKDFLLEWVLGEYLDDNEFKELGIVIMSNWDIEQNNTHTTIYKIGGKFIKSTFKNGEYLIKHKIEFVKRVEKKITIYTYEPIIDFKKQNAQ